MRAPTFEITLPRLGLACAIGVVLVIVGRVTGSELTGDIGALFMAPLVVVAGLSCMLVVLLAPAWPLATLAAKVPSAWVWPFNLAALAVTVLWWWLVVACVIAEPPGLGY